MVKRKEYTINSLAAVFMTLRQYLIVMILATFLCWASLILVILNVDPFQANWLSLGFFYLSLFLALLGTFVLLFFLLFHLTPRRISPMFRQVAQSFHLGLLVALALTALVYFLGRGWLEIWNTAVFLGALASFIVFLAFPNLV